VESVIKNDRNDQPDRLKLYYFPDINVDLSPESDRAIGQDAGFQKADFGRGAGIDQTMTGHGQTGGHNVESLHDIRDKLYHQGFEDGQSVGAKEMEDRYGSIMNQVQNAVDDLIRRKEEIEGQAEREIVSLAFAIAEKIIKQELKLDRNIVLNSVKEALMQTTDKEALKFIVHPSDLPVIESAMHQFTDLLENPDKVTLESDSTVSPGGCVVETRSCSVDANIEKQLKLIEASLKKAFPNS